MPNVSDTPTIQSCESAWSDERECFIAGISVDNIEPVFWRGSGDGRPYHGKLCGVVGAVGDGLLVAWVGVLAGGG